VRQLPLLSIGPPQLGNRKSVIPPFLGQAMIAENLRRRTRRWRIKRRCLRPMTHAPLGIGRAVPQGGTRRRRSQRVAALTAEGPSEPSRRDERENYGRRRVRGNGGRRLDIADPRFQRGKNQRERVRSRRPASPAPSPQHLAPVT